MGLRRRPSMSAVSIHRTVSPPAPKAKSPATVAPARFKAVKVAPLTSTLPAILLRGNSAGRSKRASTI